MLHSPWDSPPFPDPALVAVKAYLISAASPWIISAVGNIGKRKVIRRLDQYIIVVKIGFCLLKKNEVER